MPPVFCALWLAVAVMLAITESVTIEVGTALLD
jgi:hypothetical protein